MTQMMSNTHINRFGLSYNERILIGIVIIASILFFVVPSILVGVFIRNGWSSVIGMPFPLIIVSISFYVLWRVRASIKARKQYDEMAAAAQPVTPGDHEFQPPAAGTLSDVTPHNNLAQISMPNPAQSENEKEKMNRTAEVQQVDNESERTMEEQ